MRARAGQSRFWFLRGCCLIGTINKAATAWKFIVFSSYFTQCYCVLVVLIAAYGYSRTRRMNKSRVDFVFVGSCHSLAFIEQKNHCIITLVDSKRSE